MVKIEPDLNKYSEVFITRATAYYPELLDGFELKKKRGKKSNLYFIESVGRHLWEKWSADKSSENQNDFVTYQGKGIKMCDEWKGNFKNFYDWSISIYSASC